MALLGKAGLAMIADHRPNAILVDGFMPEMDGASVIRRVRLDAATRALPCLLLTAHDESDAQLRALESGADAFVPKDGDSELILARLAAYTPRRVEIDGLKRVEGPSKLGDFHYAPILFFEGEKVRACMARPS